VLPGSAGLGDGLAVIAGWVGGGGDLYRRRVCRRLIWLIAPLGVWLR
jgi:hypothetical protein